MGKTALDTVQITVGAARLSKDLGGYYLNFIPVLPLVESGYHGPIDSEGVPLNSYGAAGDYYNTITIAQYALALHDKIIGGDSSDALGRRLAAQYDAIMRNTESAGEWRGFFLHRWDNPKYTDLRAPWVSALSQGNALSALLRGYQLSGDERLMATAAIMFDALDRELSDGGVRAVDGCGHLWFEEYPMNPPSHVLNGFIFALWGVLDYARATGSAKAWDWWKAGVETLSAHIADYDCGYWSIYDLSHRELASLYYQVNIHVPQLEAMHLLTGERVFNHYAERWARFSASLWRRAVWWGALRVHARVRRLQSRKIGK